MAPLSRGLQALALGSLGLAMVVLFLVWPLHGDDLILHLALGQWIWQNGWVPLTDPFSYLTEGQEFIAHSWLSELLLYGIESTTGTAGFLALRFTLISASLLLACWVARCLKASWLAIMVLSPFVLGLCWGRCELRPALFSTLLLAIELWLLVSVHTGRRSWRWLWLLPLLFALAINFHPGWPQILLMLLASLGAVVLMEIRSRWLGSGGTSAIPLPQLGLVFLACVAALLINPYGWRLLVFPLEMQAPWIRMLGREFHSPLAYWDWGRFPGVFFFPRVMGLLPRPCEILR